MCACVALGGWLESSADAADAVLSNTRGVISRRQHGSRRRPRPEASSSRAPEILDASHEPARLGGALVKRGADARLAKAIRDGDDDVRFAAWACCTAAVRSSPTRSVRLLAHAGVYSRNGSFS